MERFLCGLGLAAWMVAPPVGAQAPFGLRIALNAGKAQITVTGALGTACQIQWTGTLSATSRWVHLGSRAVASPPLPLTDSNSPSATRRFYRAIRTPSTNMVWIPPGTFRMGNALGDPDIGDALPFNVTLSAFYMDATEVSLGQWQSVYAYATNQGYGFAHEGAGKAANHPVQTLDWFDAVKWCNARSQQAGRTPAYYTDPGFTTVYRTGEVTVYVNWAANGYRLPTEAEWEKAARGGVSDPRFPWGDFISQTQANYYGVTTSYPYDLGPNGYNAAYTNGLTPYTSPVGSFAPNDYGLFDMAGNVAEWCWDWYGTPYGQPTTNNPTGPATGAQRVYRGGDWGTYASNCRTAARYFRNPAVASISYGFRSVLPAGP